MKPRKHSSPYSNRLSLFCRPTRIAKLVATAAFMSVAATSTRAVNTQSTVTTGTDLTLAATYGGTLPGTTSDVIFNTGYPTAPTNFTLNSSLAIGTLNDVNANAITISDNGASNSTLTLSTAANSFSGNAADLLYVGSTGNLTIQGANGGAGAGVLTLAVGAASGNFDVASGGILNISATVSAAGKGIVNTGAGTINYSGASSGTPSAFGKFTINGGSTVNSSGFLNASGSNVGVADGSAGILNVTGGVFNAAVGANTFFDGNNATGAINVSAGAFNILNAIGSTTGAANIFIGGTYNGSGGNNGNGTITVSGGTFSTSTTTGTFQLGSTTGGTGSGTINLNGGTFSTNRAFTKGTGGAGTINFNGGTLQATGTALAIPTTVTTNVADGGGTIDSNGFAITLATNFTHGGTAATDGGLTFKSSTGTNTLSGILSFTGPLTTNSLVVLNSTANNTYTGATQVNAGELEALGTGVLPLSTSAVTVNSGANVTVGNHAGGTSQTMTNNFTLNGTGTSVSASSTSGTLAAGALAFYNSGGFSLTGNVNLASTSLIYDNPVTQTGNITFSGVISGAGGLVLAAANSNGTATNLALSGANTYGTTNATTQFTNFNGGGTMTVTLSTNNNVLPTNTVLTLGGTPAGQGGSYNAYVNVALNGINQTVAGLTTTGSGVYRIIGNSTTLSTFTVNNTANYTFGGIFGSSGTNNNNVALVKSGMGVFALSNTNTYTGGTTISGGTLLSGTSGVSTGAVSIGASGTLASSAGAVTIAAPVATAASTSGLAPGATTASNTGTVGALTLSGGLNLSSGAAIAFDLASTSTTSDKINVTAGTFTGATGTGSGNITFNFNDLGATNGTVYTLINFSGATASDVDLSDFAATGVVGMFSFNAGTPTELDFTVAVPEPATYLGGLLMVAAFGWRTRSRFTRRAA